MKLNKVTFTTQKKKKKKKKVNNSFTDSFTAAVWPFHRHFYTVAHIPAALNLMRTFNRMVFLYNLLSWLDKPAEAQQLEAPQSTIFAQFTTLLKATAYQLNFYFRTLIYSVIIEQSYWVFCVIFTSASLQWRIFSTCKDYSPLLTVHPEILQSGVLHPPPAFEVTVRVGRALITNYPMPQHHRILSILAKN